MIANAIQPDQILEYRMTPWVLHVALLRARYAPENARPVTLALARTARTRDWPTPVSRASAATER